MSAPVDELVEKAKELREAGRIDEAIIAARRATAADPEEANAWWQLALAVERKNGSAAALEHFKKTVEFANGFAYGWHKLGLAYKKGGMLGEAIDSWEEALSCDDERHDTLQALADAYGQREFDGDDDRRFEALKKLDEMGRLRDGDLNRLGIFYHQNGSIHQAIRCYRKLARLDDAIGYFNLGLALSSDEAGQDLDAIDALRKSMDIDPDPDKTQKRIDLVSKRLADLRARISESDKKLLTEDQHFAHYVNPFELLDLDDVDDVFDMDVKPIQKAKKALLQEIELEDGKVEWVPGLHIDKSRAIQIVDGLNDADSRYWHYSIFKNKKLLAFLSRGSIDLFLDDGESPLAFIDSMMAFEGEFEELAGAAFAAQYDAILGKALEQGSVDVVKALLSGRLWVSPEQEDKCFESAQRQIEKMLEPLSALSDKAEHEKPSFEQVKSALAKGGLSSLLVILPIRFQSIQKRAAELVRGIAIDSNNHHDDAALGKQIMGLAKVFAAKSPSIAAKIKEDLQVFEENLAIQARKKEAERLEVLLQPLRAAADRSEKIKPSLQGIKDLLAEGNLSSILMALPSQLSRFQNDAASIIRSISVDANNRHDDAELARDILQLAKSILPRSSDYMSTIDEDMATLADLIKKENAHEAHLTLRGESYSVTKKAVRFGARSLAAQDTRRIRWGVTTIGSGSTVRREYLFSVAGAYGGDISISWTSTSDLETQQRLFGGLIDAAFAYLMPSILAGIRKELADGKTLNIGEAVVDKHGMAFTISGWFSNKIERCPWNRLRSEIINGDVVITDPANSKCRVALPLAQVDNAIALHVLIKNTS